MTSVTSQRQDRADQRTANSGELRLAAVAGSKEGPIKLRARPAPLSRRFSSQATSRSLTRRFVSGVTNRQRHTRHRDRLEQDDVERNQSGSRYLAAFRSWVAFTRPPLMATMTLGKRFHRVAPRPRSRRTAPASPQPSASSSLTALRAGSAISLDIRRSGRCSDAETCAASSSGAGAGQEPFQRSLRMPRPAGHSAAVARLRAAGRAPAAEQRPLDRSTEFGRKIVGRAGNRDLARCPTWRGDAASWHAQTIRVP